MTGICRKALACLTVGALLLVTALPFRVAVATEHAVQAKPVESEATTYDHKYKHSDGIGMILDGIVVRPISLVVTVVGAVFFVVTVPFSALGGNTAEAWDQMVEEPAAFTFNRCLGCWPRGL